MSSWLTALLTVSTTSGTCMQCTHTHHQRLGQTTKGMHLAHQRDVRSCPTAECALLYTVCLAVHSVPCCHTHIVRTQPTQVTHRSHTSDSGPQPGMTDHATIGHAEQTSACMYVAAGLYHTHITCLSHAYRIWRAYCMPIAPDSPHAHRCHCHCFHCRYHDNRFLPRQQRHRCRFQSLG